MWLSLRLAVSGIAAAARRRFGAAVGLARARRLLAEGGRGMSRLSGGGPQGWR